GGEVGSTADEHGVAVVASALVHDGLEQLVVGRVVDDADGDLAVHLGGDGHRPHREPVQVVGRAVERVDDPPDATAVAGGGRRGGGALLAEEAVTWPGRTNRLRYQVLRGAVHLGHHVRAG